MKIDDNNHYSIATIDIDWYKFNESHINKIKEVVIRISHVHIFYLKFLINKH